MDRGNVNLVPLLVWERIRYHRRTARLARYIEEHPEEHLTLEKASEIACMERTSLSRFFRQRIGMNFSDFLSTYRIHLAIREMLKGDAYLKEIAQSVGFGCMATFERQFKRQTGKTPSRYRARELARRGLVAGSH